MIPDLATAAGEGLPPGEAVSPSPSAARAPKRVSRAARRWLAGQARPGRPFFLAAGAADAVAALGTVLLSWYAAGLIVAGVTDGQDLGRAVLGVAVGGVLRAAGAFAADRLAGVGGERVEAAVRGTVLDTLVLTGPADLAGTQVSPGAAVAAVCEQLPRLGDHFRDYQRRAVAACAVPAVILAAIFPASWVTGALLTLATPIVPVNMVVTGLGAEAVSRRQLDQVAQLSGQVLERLQAMSTLRALGAIGHQRRLVERAAIELARRTTAVLRVAFLASSALEWVSMFAIGMVAMYVGITLLGYVRVPGLPSHLGAQAGVFVLLLAPAYFAPLRRFAAAYHQRQEAVAAAEILAPLSRAAAGPDSAGPDAAGRRRTRPVRRRVSCCKTSLSAFPAGPRPRSPGSASWFPRAAPSASPGRRDRGNPPCSRSPGAGFGPARAGRCSTRGRPRSRAGGFS